jgi:hypothetical protein
MLILIVLIIIVFVAARYAMGRAGPALAGCNACNNVAPTSAQESFHVVESLPNAAGADALITRINARIIEFLSRLKKKYRVNAVSNENSDGGRAAGEGAAIADRILTNYNFETIYENDPRTSADTSYTLDKGAAMYFCLRDKKSHKLLDDDIVFFVALHEISHIGNKTFGHGRDFWTTFKFILTEAKEAGLYVPVNYAAAPVMYCGLLVDYNPYFDKSMPSY